MNVDRNTSQRGSAGMVCQKRFASWEKKSSCAIGPNHVEKVQLHKIQGVENLNCQWKAYRNDLNLLLVGMGPWSLVVFIASYTVLGSPLAGEHSFADHLISSIGRGVTQLHWAHMC